MDWKDENYYTKGRNRMKPIKNGVMNVSKLEIYRISYINKINPALHFQSKRGFTLSCCSLKTIQIGWSHKYHRF